MAVGTKALHRIKRVPQCSHIDRRVNIIISGRIPSLYCTLTTLTGPLFPIGIEHLIYMKFFCYGSSYGY